MQLVLINNTVVAHGENFLAMGGVVINTETGEKYDNATIAECSGCPSDINTRGYDYRCGVFVPRPPIKLLNLLWENTSKDRYFEAQTITLSSSNFDYLAIETWTDADDKFPGISILPKSGGCVSVLYVRDGETRPITGYRTVQVNGAQVTFSNGYCNSENSPTNYTDWTSCCVPSKIYGLNLCTY